LHNQPSFKRRILELCAAVPEVAELMVGGDGDAFAKRVRDARNVETHPGDRPGSASLHLVVLQAQLAVILEAVMLRHFFAFGGDDIARRVTRASRLRRLAIAAGRAMDDAH